MSKSHPHLRTLAQLRRIDKAFANYYVAKRAWLRKYGKPQRHTAVIIPFPPRQDA